MDTVRLYNPSKSMVTVRSYDPSKSMDTVRLYNFSKVWTLLDCTIAQKYGQC